MGKGAIWIGTILVILGIWFTYNIISSEETPNWLLIHVSVMIILGLGLIILYREEDKIEPRKDLNKKKSK